MISISIYQKADGRTIGFKSSGHAGFSDYGNDIICAAVSILVLNSINSIEEYTDCDFHVDENEKKGYIEFIIESEPTSETELLLKSLVLGLTGISNEYGKEYIKIIFEEV